MNILSLLPVAGVSAAGERCGTLPVALVPRHVLDRPAVLARRDGAMSERDAALAKRDGGCEEGFHNCLDIDQNKCCDNQSYCYVNKAGEGKCCPIGSNCVENSFCRSDSYFCKGRVTVDGVVETGRDGCCQRKCPQTSHFLCPQSRGGKCCPYAAECRAGGKCLETVTASSAPTPGIITPGGCSASQYRCADGTGCCDDGQRCTRLSGTAYCAAGSSPTGDTGAWSVDASPPGPGLSAGAKAAVGTTVALALSFVLGAMAWICISTRSRRRRRQQRAAAERAAARSPDGAEMRGLAETNLAPRPRPGRGLTQVYSGPNPVAGPYTDAATLDELRMSLPGLARAGPSRPDGPGDIVAPVEMDSSSTPNRPRQTSPGPFELDGAGAYPYPPPSYQRLLVSPGTPPMDK